MNVTEVDANDDVDVVMDVDDVFVSVDNRKEEGASAVLIWLLM